MSQTDSLILDAPASAWFTLKLGALIRGDVRREIEKAAWGRGLDIDVRESKGFFESVYKFTVTGRPEAVKQFLADTNAWIKANFND
jgi:hypothetical protein